MDAMRVSARLALVMGALALSPVAGADEPSLPSAAEPDPMWRSPWTLSFSAVRYRPGPPPAVRSGGMRAEYALRGGVLAGPWFNGFRVLGTVEGWVGFDFAKRKYRDLAVVEPQLPARRTAAVFGPYLRLAASSGVDHNGPWGMRQLDLGVRVDIRRETRPPRP